MGKNYVNGKTFLEKRYDDNMELEDAVHTAILTLKEGFEGQVNNNATFFIWFWFAFFKICQNLEPSNWTRSQ